MQQRPLKEEINKSINKCSCSSSKKSLEAIPSNKLLTSTGCVWRTFVCAASEALHGDVPLVPAGEQFELTRAAVRLSICTAHLLLIQPLWRCNPSVRCVRARQVARALSEGRCLLHAGGAEVAGQFRAAGSGNLQFTWEGRGSGERWWDERAAAQLPRGRGQLAWLQCDEHLDLLKYQYLPRSYNSWFTLTTWDKSLQIQIQLNLGCGGMSWHFKNRVNKTQL